MKGFVDKKASAWQTGLPIIAQKIYSLGAVSTAANKASIPEPKAICNGCLGGTGGAGGKSKPPPAKIDHLPPS